jgi:hypothetical protein
MYSHPPSASRHSCTHDLLTQHAHVSHLAQQCVHHVSAGPSHHRVHGNVSRIAYRVVIWGTSVVLLCCLCPWPRMHVGWSAPCRERSSIFFAARLDVDARPHRSRRRGERLDVDARPHRSRRRGERLDVDARPHRSRRRGSVAHPHRPPQPLPGSRRPAHTHQMPHLPSCAAS